MGTEVAVRGSQEVAMTQQDIDAKLREMLLSGEYSYEDMAKATGQEPEKTGAKYFPQISIQKSTNRKAADGTIHKGIPAPSFSVVVPGKGLVFTKVDQTLNFRIFQSRWQIRRWDAKQEKYTGMSAFFMEQYGNAIDDQGTENCGYPTDYYDWKKGKAEDPERHEWIIQAKRSNIVFGVVSPFTGVDIEGNEVVVDEPFIASTRLPRSSQESMKVVMAALKAARLQQFLVELEMDIGMGEAGNDFYYFQTLKYTGPDSVVTLDKEKDIAHWDTIAEYIREHDADIEAKHIKKLGSGGYKGNPDLPLDQVESSSGDGFATDLDDAPFCGDDLDDEIPF